MTLSLPGVPLARPVKPPRVEHAPEASDYSAAVEALEIAELAGLVLDDWQQWALVRGMGQDDDGKWASFETALIIPRQNGKTEIILAVLLAGLFTELEDPRLLMYTAHEYKTAREVFHRLSFLLSPPADVDPILVADPFLREQIARVRTANGEEAIELHNGRRLRMLARTSGSGRGFTGDRLVFDECQHLTAEQMGATLPTLSARPNPQVWYGAAGPLEHSEVQAGIRDRALSQGDGLTYIEYSVDDDADLDDEDAWAQANPAHPHRISTAHIRRERAALGDIEFARERLCQHGGKRHAVIQPDVWLALSDATSQVKDTFRFAVDIPPERSTAAIAVAGLRADGIPHVELVEYESGTEWAVARLVELSKKHSAPVLLDPASPAGSLIAPLSKAGVEPVLVTGREMAQACGQFYDAVQGGKLVHHPGAHETVMNRAVDAGRKRSVSDAWAWHRRDTAADISPLVAATLAVYGIGKEAGKKASPGRWMTGGKSPCECGCGKLSETRFATKACKQRSEAANG